MLNGSDQPFEFQNENINLYYEPNDAMNNTINSIHN